MKETLKNLKKVYEFGKKYNKNLYIFIIVSFMFIVVNVIYPIFTAKQLTYLTEGTFKSLIYASLIVLIFDILKSLRMIVIRKNTQVYFRGSLKEIQLAVSKEILKIEVSDIDKNNSGVFIERLNKDCNELSHIFSMGVGHLTGFLSNLGVFIAVFIINKYLFIYYLLAALVLTALHLLRVKKVNEKEVIVRQKQETNIGLTSELVRGVRDIKMLNAKESFIYKLEESIKNVADSIFKWRNTDMFYNSLIEITTSLFQFILILILIYLIRINNINIATAIVLYSYRSNVMVNLMGKIGDLLSEIKSFNLSSSRVFSLLESNEFKKENFGKKHINKIKGEFEFSNVSFAYNSNKVLNDISFKINPNETIGFVGKSGAGKTTIFNLLCKMYNIKEGSISIDGININELDEGSIRGNITIISQNPYIFNLSIKDNLRLVKKDVTDEEIKNACKLACLDEFIENLPDKYDTIVGEGGVTLSGGQRQRLAIARAFVQNTKIILFDEATSALDNETQAQIHQAITNMKKDYTILIIAHRLSTISNCDKIMVIDDGKIIATGRHEELLNSSAEYRKLYKTEII